MQTTNLASTIQAAITAAGLSQRNLAAETGISQASISRIIAGQRAPKMPEILRIAQATGHTVAQLTGQTPALEFAARASNSSTMDAMRERMRYFAELNAYLDDHAIAK